jgi:hypothetical protein
MTRMDKAKPFGIAKRDVRAAYKQVKANRGAAGVDGQSIEEFDRDLRKNLYRIWNRIVFRQLFSATRASRRHTEGNFRRGPAAWYSNGLRQHRPDGRQTIPGADPGTRL